MRKRLTSVIMVLVMALSSMTTLTFAGSIDADYGADYKEAKAKTESYMLKKVPNPGFGDEWYIIGLARGGKNVPQSYYDGYYKNLEKHVKECKGVLHARKYTEYSRVILAVTAIGKDPSNVGGYNLLKKLSDFDKVKWQGVNGPIWALIALDSGNYTIPKDSNAVKQSTRDNLIDEILRQEIPGGGFHLSENSAEPDPDMTGMAVQALAGYTAKRADVKSAVDRAVEAMSYMQKVDGTFCNSMMGGTKTVESSCQVITGLSALGIDADKDERFIRNGISAIDGLMSFYDKNGGFRHVNEASGGYEPVVNSMATEQGFYTLTAYDRMKNGKKFIYDMTDVKPVSKPAKVTVSSAKSLSSKSLTVKWKKVSSAKGYQVRYAVNSKFTGSKTTTTSSLSKTVKSLKKGKYYYVKVRAYKTDAKGNKIYGSYSAVKKVKVK